MQILTRKKISFECCVKAIVFITQFFPIFGAHANRTTPEIVCLTAILHQ